MYDEEQKRTELLLALYEMADGNSIQGVMDKDLIQRLNLDAQRFQRMALFLKEEGLIRFQTFSSISLAHGGIKKVETIMEESYSRKKKRVLEAIGDMSRMTRIVLFPSLVDRVGMTDQELSVICNGLDEQGLINFPGGDFVEMKDAGYEALEPPKQTTPSTVNYMNINHNYGAAAQGSDFTQNVSTHKAEFDESINKLLKAVGASEQLSSVQKITLTNDINVVHQLGQMEKDPGRCRSRLLEN